MEFMILKSEYLFNKEKRQTNLPSYCSLISMRGGVWRGRDFAGASAHALRFDVSARASRRIFDQQPQESPDPRHLIRNAFEEWLPLSTKVLREFLQRASHSPLFQRVRTAILLIYPRQNHSILNHHLQRVDQGKPAPLQ